MMGRLLPLLLLGWLVTGACTSDPVRAPGREDDDALRGPVEGTFAMPDAAERPYWLHLPPAADGVTPLPVVVGLHDANTRPDVFRSLTCPDGRTDDEGCFTALADREGFILVVPSGTSAVLFDDARAWNAGGGTTVHCTSGRACAEGIDDVAYLDAVLAEVERAAPIDRARVFVTGMGNGGAMAHRVACERSTVYAAVAAVAGGNQVAVDQGCPVARPVPVLQIHGDADTCWAFDGTSDCTKDSPLPLVDVDVSMEGWRQRNGCSVEVGSTALPDNADDGTTTTREAFVGCIDDASVELLRVSGGGHTWPGGHAYAGEDRIGRTARDFLAAAEIWSFFERHPLPAALVPGAVP